MFSLNEKSLATCFYILCLTSAFLMTLWATVEYFKNEDVIEISYRKFNQNEEDSQYPAMSLCFMDAYKESSFRGAFGEKINITAYKDFINGNTWNENMIKIDYDDVTIDIGDYLFDTCMVTTMSRSCQGIKKIDPIAFPSPLGVLKCFSFHHIFGSKYQFHKKIGADTRTSLDEVMIAMNTSIFPNGIRPSSGRFLVMFHYPFQLVRSIYTTYYNWPSRDKSSPRYYAMQFNIKAVETLKRRNNGNQECYQWQQFDSETFEDVMQSVGCRPPYWKSKYDHPSCNSSKQMSSVAMHYQAKLYQDDKFENIVPPCVEIKKMDVEFEEHTGDKSKNEFNNDFYDRFENIAGTKDDWFIIHLHFWSSIDFKEIKQIRAYSILSAIGNASGYIGFLVGLSISELPSLIFWIYGKIKHYWKYSNNPWKHSSTDNGNIEIKYQETNEQLISGENQVTYKNLQDLQEHVDKQISELTKYVSNYNPKTLGKRKKQPN